jgi:type I restriction enzyme S subunit
VTQIDRGESVIAENKYRLLGVRLEGNGAFLRETVAGSETSASRLYRVESGDFIYSRLFAWRGAFGVIPPPLDGCYVSNEFPLFHANGAKLEAGYLNRWFQLPSVWRRVEENCTGSTPTTRNRFKENHFLDLEIPLPPLAEQQALVGRLDALADKTRQLTTHLDAIDTEADAIVRSYLFGDAAHSYPKRKMAELVQLRSPDVSVDRLLRYQFAGVYCFGRGVFASANKAGSDFAYDRLSAIKAGDFIYPKLMAWEGALGIVPQECDGMVVSPEFPVFTVNTEVVLPEILDIYFRTPSVWPELAALSGGTNVRRRRIQPSAFLDYEMPLPPMPIQRKVRELYKRTSALKYRHATLRKSNAALLPATLERLFSCASLSI